MGPIKLPFHGPLSDIQVFDPSRIKLDGNGVLYAGVVFTRESINGKVVLRFRQADGNFLEMPFEQGAGAMQMIAMPLRAYGVVIKEATDGARGYVLVATESGHASE